MCKAYPRLVCTNTAMAVLVQVKCLLSVVIQKITGWIESRLG